MSSPASPRRRLVLGVAYQVLGWALVLGCIAPMIVCNNTRLGENAIILWMSLLASVPMFVGGSLLMRRGMKLAARRGDAVLSHLTGDAAPIVYLRSFSEEQNDNLLSGFLSGMLGYWISLDVPGWGSQEQQFLSIYLRQIGPYIAIGRPGEPLPELGASRIYVGDDWQERVLDLLARARLVVLRAGRSPGLQWEVAKIVDTVQPRRILLILPVRRKDYLAFRDWSVAVLPKPLPESQPVERLVIFDDDWTPVLLPARQLLSQTLRPLLDRNNIVPPQSWVF